jgi:hypothetical protein
MDPYFTPIFYNQDNQLQATFDQQIAKLFQVKGKWCLSELEIFLKDFVEPEGKLLQLLGTWTRTMKE